VNAGEQLSGSSNNPAPPEAIQGAIPAGAGNPSLLVQSSAAPAPSLYGPDLEKIDQPLIDRARQLSERAADYATAYLCAGTLYNQTGRPEARLLAIKAKIKLTDLLAYPFGFKDRSKPAAG